MKKILKFTMILTILLFLVSCKADAKIESDSFIETNNQIINNVETKRDMTPKEIFEFAKFLDTEEVLTILDEEASFVQFLRNLNTLQPDICSPVTEKEREIIEGIGWDIDDNYYWANEEDVLELWQNYVDESSDIPLEVSVFDGTYYSSEEERYYFYDNYFFSDLELKRGEIDGDKATLYTTNYRINLKETDGVWRIVSYYKGMRLEDASWENMQRLTGDELWELYLQIDDTSTLIDGYTDGIHYILYSEWVMHYLLFENGEYTVVLSTQLDTKRERSVYRDEGVYTKIQYEIDEDFMPRDESKSEEYNAAIDAYREYILKNAKERLKLLNEDNYFTTLPTTLEDLNKDGIPEIIVRESLYPPSVYSFRDGEIVELLGTRSNGQHGNCGLLENGMYASKHFTTGWFTSFVTYNLDGTQTIETFSYYGDYEYSSETVNSAKDYNENNYINEKTVVVNYGSAEESEKQFYEKYAPYEALLENFAIKETISPFKIIEDLNYSPDVLKRING